MLQVGSWVEAVLQIDDAVLQVGGWAGTVLKQLEVGPRLGVGLSHCCWLKAPQTRCTE